MKARNRTIPYSKRELFEAPAVRRFSGRQLDEIAFPIGGIGTGCISLGGWGQLRDWEIFNRPNKGYNPNVCFFALHAREAGRRPEARLLRGRPQGSYVGDGHGRFDWAAGFPPMRTCTFTGRFPFAELSLRDPRVPLSVCLEAFNPFIPLDDRNSSIPIAIFLFHLRNTAKRPVTARLFAGLENIAGHPDMRGGSNRTRRTGGVGGVMLENRSHAPDSPRHSTLALVSPHRDQAATAGAVVGTGHGEKWAFWRSFERTGLPPCRVQEAKNGEKNRAVGGLTLKTRIQPGATATLPVFIAWHSPVSDAGSAWRADTDAQGWKTYVAACFKDAWDVAAHTARHLPELEAKTRLFAKRLYTSSLPGVAVEAAGSQISILKSTTCLRFEDGGFWGWEGVSNKAGCCAGTCTHVWNYAQALPYLFPALARSVRDQQYDLNMDENGRMCFRQPLPPGSKGNPEDFYAAADGQLGGVMRVYREWLISGNEAWLQKTWPKCKKALEYAWLYWDADKDGVMEGVQHNTFDNEFWGPNTMLSSVYLGALRAGEEMARHLGDERSADVYRRIFESGRAWMDRNLFNGKWYRQIINPNANAHTDRKSNHLVEGEKIPRWQYGEGCLSDQLIGQWYAEMLQLGYLYEPAHVRRTLRSIFRHNWRADLDDHATLLRSYAFAGEAGLIVCTWPDGGEPPYPFWFSSEVWCGCEYQVASHLIYEGFLEEGLAIVKGCRDRHDGTRRNPWDEFECGHHYSRSMASWALLLALAGFEYNAHEARIGFAPRVSQKDFHVFFCAEAAWGVFRQNAAGAVFKAEIQVDHGALPVKQLVLAPPAKDTKRAEARSGGRKIPCRLKRTGKGVAVAFDGSVTIGAGKTLKVTLR
ncbi:MAG: hypothetical protein JXR37_23045 [Kiritimatiellae bacterium]|nr:hypothetical protein [Kiritimatiellia bacterium]